MGGPNAKTKIVGKSRCVSQQRCVSAELPPLQGWKGGRVEKNNYAIGMVRRTGEAFLMPRHLDRWQRGRLLLTAD